MAVCDSASLFELFIAEHAVRIQIRVQHPLLHLNSHSMENLHSLLIYTNPEDSKSVFEKIGSFSGILFNMAKYYIRSNYVGKR